MILLARKKIVFIIVEGPSDDEALGIFFTRLFDKQSVHVAITHGDITSDDKNSPKNIVSKICNNDYKESWEFIRKDLNSLNRYSNLGICFAEIRKERNNGIN